MGPLLLLQYTCYCDHCVWRWLWGPESCRYQGYDCDYLYYLAMLHLGHSVLNEQRPLLYQGSAVVTVTELL